MRVLFDIVHPAHAHFYRFLHRRLQEEGHECLVLARDKEVTLALLDDFGIQFATHGRPQQGRARQARELMSRDLRLYRMGLDFKPDIVLARNPAGIHAARALRAIGVFDTDDGRAGGNISRLAVRPAAMVTSPQSLDEDYGRKHLRYPGYKSLAFLHPDHFTPDPAVRARLGVGDDRYALVRLTAMDSAHDHRQEGVPSAVVDEVIENLHGEMRVFVSSEGVLPPRWAGLALPIDAADLHHAISAASIVVGDSGSMVGEAAVLGTPAVFCGSFAHRRACLVDLERSWDLARVYLPGESDQMLATVSALVADPATPRVWAERRAALLENAVDVSSWYYDLLMSLHDHGVSATAASRRGLGG